MLDLVYVIGAVALLALIALLARRHEVLYRAAIVISGNRTAGWCGGRRPGARGQRGRASADKASRRSGPVWPHSPGL
jgi:hypothetical protein